MLLGWAYAQRVELRTVEPLQKPVSLQLVMRPLREAVEQIAAQTGATLGVAKAIEQYKITLIVRERPAWQTLELMAQVYELEWRSDAPSRYYLAESAAARTRRQRLQGARLEAVQRALEARLRAYQQAAQTDFATLRQRLEAIDAERAQLETEQPPNWTARAQQLATERAQIGIAGDSLLGYLLGVVSQRWTREQWLRLLSGQPLLASTTPLPGALALPDSTLRWLALWSPAFAEPLPQSAQMLIRLDIQRGTLELALVARTGEQALPFTESISLGVGQETPVALSSEPIPDALAAQPLRVKPDEPAPQPPYWGKQFTLAEHLAWLAAHSELNIVADAFRLPTARVEPHRNARSLGDWLRDVQANEPVALRFPEAGWLLVRHLRQAELLASEIDEPTLARFEARASEGLTLDEYAELAYALTPAQQQRLEQPHGYALRFDPTPLQSNAPALRFWASLSPAQRQAARERQPLEYPQLSALQQRLFWEALENALLRPTIPSGELLLQLDRLYDPQSHAELAFFLDFWKNVAFEIDNGTVRLTFEDVQSYEQTLKELQAQGANLTVRRQARLNYFLHFGYDTRRAAIYSISLNQRENTTAQTENGLR